MDTEFHYYVTYLIALRAGFASSDSYKIAYSSQYVDDNYDVIEVHDHKYKVIYRNTITQNYNSLLPSIVTDHIYPVYHFVPGRLYKKCSHRKDGKVHVLETQPDNNNVRSVLRASLKSANPYWIGIASHAFVDSWAHQNFTGTLDCYNAIPGFYRSAIANLGHADAIADPDYIGYIWHDPRLIKEKVNNNKRFIQAALRLLEEYLDFFGEKHHSRVKLLKETRIQLMDAFGAATKSLLFNLLANYPKRIKKYHMLSSIYNGSDIIPYKKTAWLKCALKKSPVANLYRWSDLKKYQISDWYLFQKAAVTHHKFIWPVITNAIK